MYENPADNLSNNMRLNEIFTLKFFPILLWNKQKPIRNSCRSNLWPTLILILLNIEFKILRKRPGDEAFRVSFKFPRGRWDQRLADFNRFSTVETQRSCHSSLILYLLGHTQQPISFQQICICHLSSTVKCFVYHFFSSNSSV